MEMELQIGTLLCVESQYLEKGSKIVALSFQLSSLFSLGSSFYEKVNFSLNSELQTGTPFFCADFVFL